jgi:hypothetical protein
MIGAGRSRLREQSGRWAGALAQWCRAHPAARSTCDPTSRPGARPQVLLGDSSPADTIRGARPAGVTTSELKSGQRPTSGRDVARTKSVADLHLFASEARRPRASFQPAERAVSGRASGWPTVVGRRRRGPSSPAQGSGANSKVWRVASDACERRQCHLDGRLMVAARGRRRGRESGRFLSDSIPTTICQLPRRPAEAQSSCRSLARTPAERRIIISRGGICKQFADLRARTSLALRRRAGRLVRARGAIKIKSGARSAGLLARGAAKAGAL